MVTARLFQDPTQMYQDLVNRELITPCPVPIKESTMDAIYYHCAGKQVAANKAREDNRDSVVRLAWLQKTLDAL